MRPVNDPALTVPLVHSAEIDAIANPDGSAVRNVEVVCDQQRLPGRKPEDEALVRDIVMIFVEQSNHDARVFDPLVPRCLVVLAWTGSTFSKGLLSSHHAGILATGRGGRKRKKKRGRMAAFLVTLEVND